VSVVDAQIPPRQGVLRAPPHQNHGLFSDHYLDHTLPNRPDWRHLAQDVALTEALAAIRATFAAFTPSGNEAQTEDDLIKPVLKALGHASVEVQPTIDVPGTAKRPDYIFYASEAARQANKNKKLTESLLAGTAYAVGDAKYWDRKLDLSLKVGDAATNANPASQIDFYVRHTGLDWGMLTNGRLWRLYIRTVRSTSIATTRSTSKPWPTTAIRRASPTSTPSSTAAPSPPAI
jgi:hypothetical protein